MPKSKPQTITTSSSSMAINSTSSSAIELVEQQSLIHKKPNFAEFLQYILVTRPPLENPLWSFSILTPAAIAGTWMYIRSSWEEGLNEGGLPMAIAQVIGTPGSAALVVYNIGGHYVGLVTASLDVLRYLKTHGLIARESYTETKNCLISCSNSLGRNIRNIYNKLHESKLDVLTISAIISTTLAATALFYKDFSNEPEWLIIVKALITLAVNTVDHTLPVSFILNIHWLNTLLVKIPLSPFIFSRYLYRTCCWSQDKKIQSAHEQKLIQKQAALKRQATSKIYTLINQIQKFGWERHGCIYSPKISDQINQLLQTIQNDEERDQDRDKKALELLLPLLANYYKAPTATDQNHHSILWNCLTYLDSGIKNIVGLTGAVLVGGSISGYLKVNYDLYYKALNNSAIISAILMAPTFFTAEVLCTYFGWIAFAGAYEFISHWLTCRPQWPYAFKLSPILSILFLASTWTLAAFGYGTALQLVYDTFDPKVYGKILRRLLELAAKYGIIVYGAINFAQLLEKVIPMAIKQLPSNSPERKQYLFILDFLKRLVTSIEEFPQELLQEMLNTIDDPNALKFFGLVKNVEGIAIREEEAIPAINAEPNTSAAAHASSSTSNKQSWYDWACGFFHRSAAPKPQRPDAEYVPIV